MEQKLAEAEKEVEKLKKEATDAREEVQVIRR